jgi:DegV family protein with EDD domain
VPGIAVVTDSTAEFGDVHPSKLGITIVPLTVNWGHDVLRDGVDITSGEFYTRLRLDPDLPRTAAPPVGIFEDVYRNLLTEHDAVISIHISSKLSGTSGVALNAARATDVSRVHVVDSLSVSIGLGWLAQHAAELAQDGATPETIVRALYDMPRRERLFIAIETLEYLQKGGRIGRAQAFLGGLLNVKPVLELRDGELHPLERVRTRAASLRRLVELASSVGTAERVGVVHADSAKEAEAVAQELGARLPSPSIPIVEFGPVIGTHAGPGVVAVGLLLAS